MSNAVDPWDDNKILVVPNEPRDAALDDAEHTYPLATINFVKQLRGSGLPVEVATPKESQAFLSYNAHELWLPLMNIGISVLIGAAGNLIASMIEQAVHGEAKTRVHIKWQVRDAHGRKHKFEFDGTAGAAKDAAKAFEAALWTTDDASN